MPRPRGRPPPWTVVYDKTYDAWYYFNTQTGDSEWVEDVESTETSTTDLDEIELTRIATESVSESTAKRGSGADSIKADRDDEESDEEDEEEEDDGGVSLIKDSDRVHADTQSALNAHMRCMFLTACLCESPLAVAEGAMRSATFLAGGVFFLLVAAISPISTRAQWMSRAQSCTREVILTIAAMLTLLLPCTACLVYRKYDDEEDWDLAPLPTVLGWVDSQRFVAFTFGGGTQARTRTGVRSESSPASGDSNLAGAVDFHDSRSNDSWGSGILLAPRKVLKSLRRIADGEAEAVFYDDIEMR
jgi:hypothetical protein